MLRHVYGLLAVLMFWALPAQAQYPANSLPAESPDYAPPQKAWGVFCNAREYYALCLIDTKEPEVIPYSAKLMKQLDEVNSEINQRLFPLNDDEHWGVADRWDLAEDGKGDCEDYQLLKREHLVTRYGWPRRAMRMTVVIDEEGGGHAVLMVRTNKGDVILDNKRNKVVLWHQTPYTYLKRERADAVGWEGLGNKKGTYTTFTPLVASR